VVIVHLCWKSYRSIGKGGRGERNDEQGIRPGGSTNSSTNTNANINIITNGWCCNIIGTLMHQHNSIGGCCSITSIVIATSSNATMQLHRLNKMYRPRMRERQQQSQLPLSVKHTVDFPDRLHLLRH